MLMEIWSLVYFGVTALIFWGSHDVIGHVSIGLCICAFLLVVHYNHMSILHGYASKFVLPVLKAKSSLRMPHVT